jgi:nitroimidazol reductase NimA-like FMN-containing flavoprotein (pyridoxamine 5'-phosphate oxidase superfamily)
VNYVVDGRTIVFRTDRGTTLAGLLRWSSVAFEIDEIDRADRTGWSVLVKGDAREVTSPDQLATLRARPLDVWRVGEAPRWIRVVPAEVTGRRLLRWGGPSREPSALTGA